MSIFTYNGKRISIDAPIVYKNVQYNNLYDPNLRATIGIIEHPEPQPPEGYDPDFYYKNEIPEAPFIQYTRKSDEQIAQIMLNRAKVARVNAVGSLKVTTTAGNEFDADETSQNRMSRAITGMSESDTLPWVLANNNVIQVTRLELLEALRLAGIAMATEWLKPYQ